MEFSKLVYVVKLDIISSQNIILILTMNNNKYINL